MKCAVITSMMIYLSNIMAISAGASFANNANADKSTFILSFCFGHWFSPATECKISRVIVLSRITRAADLLSFLLFLTSSATIKPSEVVILNFSKQLQQIRIAHSMTQADLAQQLHVSRHTVSNWENERNLPDLETVTQIARIFSVSLDTLILDDSELNEKLIKDSKVSRHQLVMAVLTTADAMMAGMAATTMFGFFPQWLAELIWWVFVAVQFSFSYAITPKSVDIFADWSVRSRRFMGVGFSALGLLNLLTGLVLVWFNGIDLQLILIIIAGAGLLILTKPVWPHRQHAK